MENLKYLSEYHILKALPPETWMDFVVLKYSNKDGSGFPSPTVMFQDFFEVMEQFARTVGVRNTGSLIWFARVEDREDEDGWMPPHLHALLGHKHISTRTIPKSPLKLWVNPFARSLWVEKHWRHGPVFVEPFDRHKGDGVGYVCKDNSDYQDTFFSTGLKNLIKEVIPDEK